MFLLVIRLLAVYFATAALALWLCHRFVMAIRPRAAFLIAFGPFLLVGKALLTAGVYAPIDITYQAPPLRPYARQLGTGVTQNPILGDVVYQEIPWRKAVREAVKNGRLPLWNRFILAGEPLMAVQQPVVFHPATWISFLLPLAQGWTFEMALRIFLALLCAHLFLREAGCSEVAALFGAFAWAFCDYLIFFLGYPLTPAAAPFPLLLLGLRRLAASPGWRAATLTVVALLLIGTSGHPETLLHTVAGAGVFFLFDLAAQPAGKRVKPILLSLLAGGLTLGLLAVLLLPLAEALPHTAEQFMRATYYAKTTKSVPILQSLRRMTLDLVPYSYGMPGKGETGPGGWETAAYVGTLAWPFAMLGLFARRRERWPVAVTGLIGVLVPAHFPVITDAVGSLPIFKIAINERLVFLAAFATAALAAFGLDWLLERKEIRRLALSSAVALVVIAALFFAFKPHLQGLQMPRGYMSDRFLLQALPLLLLIAAALAANARGIRFLAAAAFVLLVVQRGLEERDVYPTYSNGAFYPPLNSLEKIPHGRPERFTAVGFTFIPNISALYELEDVRGYEAMTFEPLFATYPLWCVHQPVWFNRVDDPTRPFLSFMNVRYVYAPPGFAPPLEWKVLYRGQEGQLLENPRALERAFVPRRIRYEPDSERRMGLLWTVQDYADLGVVGLAPPAGASPSEPETNGKASARITEYFPGRMTLEIDATAPALVGTSVTSWPGWKLDLDGAPAPLLPYNHAFLAFRVPAGRHTAVLRYWPDSVVTGASISAASLATAVLLVLWPAWRRRPAVGT